MRNHPRASQRQIGATLASTDHSASGQHQGGARQKCMALPGALAAPEKSAVVSSCEARPHVPFLVHWQRLVTVAVGDHQLRDKVAKKTS
eukprot:s419_g9.t1